MTQLPPNSHPGTDITSSTGRVPGTNEELSHSPSGPHFNPTAFPSLQNSWLKLVRPRGTGYAVPEFSRACLIRLIDFPEMPFRTGVRDTIKAGRSALVVRSEFPVAGKMTSVAIKHVRRRNWVKRLTLLFRTNRVLRNWKLAHVFLARGIATAQPLAVIVPRATLLSGDGYFISEWLKGAAQPADFSRLLRPYEPRTHARRMHLAARKLGDLLGRMHAQRISHRDLKPANVLLQDQQNDVVAYVIDLDGAVLRVRVGRRNRVRDLSRLAVGLDQIAEANLAAKLRFLKSYLSVAGDTAWDWKIAWRSLSAAASARLTHREAKKRKKR